MVMIVLFHDTSALRNQLINPESSGLAGQEYSGWIDNSFLTPASQGQDSVTLIYVKH